MEILPLSAMFIVCGVHITENLQHHKCNDVKRILEDKGFKAAAGNDAGGSVHVYMQPDGADNGKRTLIVFGDQDFVHPQDGVRFYDSPESLKG